MKRNNVLLTILGAGAVISGIWYFTRPKKAEMEVLPPMMPPVPPSVAPTTPTTIPPVITTPSPALTALSIGDAVVATNTHFGVSKQIGGSVFTDGGSNGNGQIEANKYAGRIVSFVPQSNWAIVENFTYPMIDENGNNVYQYRLNKTLLRKA